MSRIIVLHIPDSDEEEIIPEQPDELAATLVKFFGNICADVHVYHPSQELENHINAQIAGGELQREPKP